MTSKRKLRRRIRRLRAELRDLQTMYWDARDALRETK